MADKRLSIIIIGVGVFVLCVSRLGYADWYNPNWQYRKQITLSGATGCGANYQVQLLVGESSGSTGADFHLGGNCRNDFGDIRFTEDDGSNALDYWIQGISGTIPNQTATVWVEVKDNLDSNQNIYIYYGNANAESASNGANTFIFFDDFSDGNDDGWTEHNGNWTVADYTYYQGDNTSAYMKTSNGESGWTDYILETKIKIASGGSTGGFAGVLFRFQDTNNHYAVMLDDRDDDSIWIRQWINGSYATEPQEWADVSIDRDTWYELRVDIFDDGANDTIKCYFGGITHEYSYSQFDSGKVALMMHGTQGYYDDVRVRKYASSEADFYSAGAEQIQETATVLRDTVIRNAIIR